MTIKQNFYNNWQEESIGNLCEIVNGKTPLRSNNEFWLNGDIPWFTIEDLRKQGNIIYKTNQFITQKALQKSGVKLVPKDSILLCCTASVGEYAITRIPVTTNQQFNSLIIRDTEKIIPDYLFQYSGMITKKLNSMMGKTTFGFVSVGILGSIKIKFPDLRTQQKIALILSSVDEEIQKTNQIIEKIKQIKKSFIQNLFSSKIGINWPLVKLNDVSIKITDGTHRTPKYIASGIPFLRINDIQSEKINWERVKYISEVEHRELIRRCHPEKGDVLLSKNGTIGITKIVDWERDFSIFVSLCLIKPDVSKISTEYLNVVLGSDYLLSQIKKRSKQGTVTNLHLEEIRDLNIALPSVDEQLLIAKQYDYLVEKINNELHYKNKLVQLKNGLMNDIFNQKVEVL